MTLAVRADHKVVVGRFTDLERTVLGVRADGFFRGRIVLDQGDNDVPFLREAIIRDDTRRLAALGEQGVRAVVFDELRVLFHRERDIALLWRERDSADVVLVGGLTFRFRSGIELTGPTNQRSFLAVIQIDKLQRHVSTFL